jgi:hypothetical protein
MDAPLYNQLHGHLFPGDEDEHGAILAVGVAESARGTRLLARELFLAQDGVDYVPSSRGYRKLTAAFVAKAANYCAAHGLGYLAVHPHGGSNAVSFSRPDLDSHERGYPALLDILGHGPVGALVFAENAVAGDIWMPEGRYPLDHLTVVGPRIRRLYPSPPRQLPQANPVYDRHARLFGDVGQHILGSLKVGIIGLGGGGSLINEELSRLGVGQIVAVDFDRVERTNLPRIVGATEADVQLKRYKVEVAERVAREANPHLQYEAVVGSVVDEATARLLSDADFLFLAGDSMQARLVFNALVHQYAIPGIQVGAKVQVDQATGEIGSIFAVTRPVLPHPEGGCLSCHQLINGTKLAEEALSEGQRRAQRYVEHDDVPEASVITLNALSVAPAVNEFMMMFTGLYEDDVQLLHLTNYVRERRLVTTAPRCEPLCLECSTTPRSRRSRGDGSRLPCRQGVK